MRKNKSDIKKQNSRKGKSNTTKNQLKSDIKGNNKQKNEIGNSSKSKSKSSGKSFIEFLKAKETHFGFGLFIILFSIFLLFSFISYLKYWRIDDAAVSSGFFNIFNSDTSVENSMGKIGAWFGYVFIKKWFGIGSFLLLIFIANCGLLLVKVKILSFFDSVIYLLGTTIWLSVFMSTIFTRQDTLIWGGIFGWQIRDWLSNSIGNVGLIFILIISFVLYLFAVLGIKMRDIKLIKNKADEIEEAEDENNINHVKIDDENNKENNDEIIIKEDTEQVLKADENFEIIHKTDIVNTEEKTNPNEIKLDITEKTNKNENSSDIPFTIEEKTNTAEDTNEEQPIDHFDINTEYDPTKTLSNYEFPPTTLLLNREVKENKVSREELEQNKDKIVETLANYSIKISEIKATIGPTVTMYEIVPAPGIRISRIKNLEDDIALSLAALGIRIIAPIPGKGTIGIEVPNKNRDIVSLRSLLESEKFINSKAELPFALGKTITNEPFVADLTKLPHLLVAGATGQGKSVGINTIICSLLYKKHPSQLKFVFIDPKKVELALYSKIEKHFLAKIPDTEEAIITDVTKVVETLRSLTQLMDSRYDLLKNAGCKNIIEYNQKFISRRLNPHDGHDYMPYIVLVVDEFADLIMTAGKEVELPIARIAQLARAVGIHLIVATQRPSVDVITGKIKANFPARIAFKVSSKVDSRTILDLNGADQLIGMGDMLYSHGSTLMRLQCAFIDTPEIEALTNHIGEQQSYPKAYELPEPIVENDNKMAEADLKNVDKLFNDAARIVVSLQQGSTSLLQTKLTIGFARARRIIEQLENAGIVGPPQGSKPRDVLIKDLEVLEQFLQNME